MKKISLKDIKLLDQDVFKNYHLLLDKKLSINKNLIEKDISKLVEKIINFNLDDISIEIELDYLFIELIRNRNKPLSIKVDWEGVCKKCAVIYSTNFNNEKFRSLRTKAVRNIYLIREIIEKNETVNTKEIEIEKTSLFFWDFRQVSNKKIFITSNKNNFIIIKNGKMKKYKVGLPTQIDILSDGSVSIGSTYSKGIFFYKNDDSIIFKNFSLPIITSFDYKKDFFILKKNGVLLKNNKIILSTKNFLAPYLKPDLFNLIFL